MASYEEINYALRPAKQIERKMICEAAGRLSEFGTIESYRYIGFGSIYFSDFIMVHRRLKISHMISIEKDYQKRDRFNFNKPFDCIQMDFGVSTQVLPRLSWNDRTILWLDYDGKLDSGVLSDIMSFCTNAVSGSMLIITVNADYRPGDADRLACLTEDVGKDMVPIHLKEKDLAGKNAAGTLRQIMSNAIEKQIYARNGGRPTVNPILWKQILSFEYSDGAKMTTFGGVLVEKGHEPQYGKCAFRSLEFVRTAPNDAYQIDIPALTYRELRYLDQHLPSSNVDNIKANGVPKKDVRSYSKVYRYFPTFAETDL